MTYTVQQLEEQLNDLRIKWKQSIGSDRKNIHARAKMLQIAIGLKRKKMGFI